MKADGAPAARASSGQAEIGFTTIVGGSRVARAAGTAGADGFASVKVGPQPPLQHGIAAPSRTAVSVSGQQEEQSALAGAARKANARSATRANRLTKSIVTRNDGGPPAIPGPLPHPFLHGGRRGTRPAVVLHEKQRPCDTDSRF